MASIFFMTILLALVEQLFFLQPADVAGLSFRPTVKARGMPSAARVRDYAKRGAVTGVADGDWGYAAVHCG
jgi:hypothetical protein